MSRKPPTSIRMSKRNCCPGAKCPQHLVMFAAMPQAHVDDLPPDAFSRRLDRHANLPVGIMAVLIDQRRRQLHFQRFVFQQIHQRRRRDRQTSHQFFRDLLAVLAAFRSRSDWDRHTSPASARPGPRAEIPVPRARPVPAKRRESGSTNSCIATPDSRYTPAKSPRASAVLPDGALRDGYAKADARPGFPASAR